MVCIVIQTILWVRLNVYLSEIKNPRSWVTVRQFKQIIIRKHRSLLFVILPFPLQGDNGETATVIELCCNFQRLYVSSSRQLRRIESVSRSPIYNNFFETINGTSTIRAYSQQQRFIRENYYRVDENQVAYYPWISSNRYIIVL
jgi:hypothetical protein